MKGCVPPHGPTAPPCTSSAPADAAAPSSGWKRLQAHQLATACPQQELKAFPDNHFILPVPCILQRFGKVLHKMEMQFNNKLNIFVNLPMVIMVFLAWLKPRAASLCGVAAAKA